jgi:NADPH-dependent 2,4-dienoyl-CoA reductase/sulfur reductase-like enzyme
MNPRTGRERTLGRSARAVTPLRVLVAGGGPAGVAAAVEAAAAGHEVVLCERRERLGGQLAIAGRAPAHRELWERYERWAVRALRGVEVRLGTAVAAADADGWDAVVVATGARPYVPPLPEGLPCETVAAVDAIADPGAVRGPALVADWGGGWTGLDAAETLAEHGVEVTLACAAAAVGEDVHQYQRNLYLGRLDRLGVRLLHHTELADGGLRHVFSSRTMPLPTGVATLVLAQGRVPDDPLWRALEGRPGVARAGDVLGPRSAEEAILEGTLAGAGVGRDDGAPAGDRAAAARAASPAR